SSQLLPSSLGGRTFRSDIVPAKEGALAPEGSDLSPGVPSCSEPVIPSEARDLLFSSSGDPFPTGPRLSLATRHSPLATSSISASDSNTRWSFHRFCHFASISCGL